MSESPWTPNLTTKTMINEWIETMIYQAPTLFGVNEIIPDCEITSVDPAAVGLGVIPRYITVRIHQYTEDVLWRGRPTDINVGDRLTVMLMAEGNRHEVLGAGGATGTDTGLFDPTARGDLLVANATPAWVVLAIGAAHQILKVNAGATDPVWASFDWDEIAAAAAADMVHSHLSNAEGGRISMLGPDGVIRIEMEVIGNAVIRLGDAAGARTLKILDSTGATVVNIDSNGYVAVDGLETNAEIYIGGDAQFDTAVNIDGYLAYHVEGVTIVVGASPYSPGSENIIYVNAVGGNVVVTPPAAATRDGKYYTIKKIDASANTVTIDPNGAETIDGALTLVITTQYTAVKIHCDGSNWWIV